MTLKIGFPSKGRLLDPAAAHFKDCGLEVIRPGGERAYRGEIKGLPDVEVWFLSATEIAQALREGRLHVGLTGEDVLAEWSSDIENAALKLRPLGFGFADVVVAVPSAWVDVTSAADLADVAAEFPRRYGRALRVATKYVNLTERAFAGWGVKNYRLVYSAGATEAAPASGIAEVIVDITTSGATLAANDLRPLPEDVILNSQACLFASLQADWSEAEAPALGVILSRMEARARARTMRLLSFKRLADKGVQKDVSAFVQKEFAATPSYLADADPSGATDFYVPAGNALEAAGAIHAIYATPVSISSPDMIFDRSEETAALVARVVSLARNRATTGSVGDA